MEELGNNPSPRRTCPIFAASPPIKEYAMSMIQIVTFILITCATATSFAQEIKGIGDFTIGMSLEKFQDLPFIKENNISPLEKNYRVYSPDVVNDFMKFEFRAPMGVPDSMGKDIYDVSTEFYKGKLAKVKADISGAAGMEFEKILTAKYGKPIKEDKMKRVTCTNRYGAKSSHLDGFETSTWGKGKKISATLLFFFYDCGKGGGSMYYVEEGAIVKVMDRIEKKGLKALEAEEAKTKAGASKL